MKNSISLPIRRAIKTSATILAACFLVVACQKELPEEEVAKQPMPDMNEYGWQLSLSDTVFGGCIDTAYFTTSGQAKTLTIQGKDQEGNVLLINLSSITGNITNGTYTASSSSGKFLFTRANLYTVGNDISPFSFHIKSINDTLIQGEFEASFYDSVAGKRLMVFDGKLVAKIGKKNTCKPFVRPVPSVAEFTVEPGANGACSNATIEGNYFTGLALNNSNLVKLKVNVKKTGTYTITTSTVNGIKFSATSTFSSTGIQTVTLLGSGTPTTGGATSIPVTAGASTCNFSITVGTGNAVFTLVGTPNTCSDADAQGIYAKGFQLSANNKVELKVDVTTIGSYAVAVGPINGITFNGAGSFTTYGLQKLVLQGSGVPVAAGDFTIPVTASGANCNFTLNVKNDSTSAGTCNVSNNTASLSANGNISFYGVTGGVSGGVYAISANGQGGELRLEFFGTTKPVAGVYNIKPVSGTFTSKDVRVSIVASNIYWAAAEGKVTVTVANGKVTGTFCNVDFTGTAGGGVLHAKGEARATEQ